MLSLFRFILMALVFLLVCILSCLYCVIRPFHRDNVYYTSKYLGKISKLLGFDVEVRIPESVKTIGPAIYVANHQDNYDIFTVANAVQPGTVTLGKKSLKWIPIFGQMYWLTGNILIDRKNSNKAMGTMNVTVKKITQNKLSVLMFPEGTRSKGRGLLPFKTGAFRTAIQANVPIIPICVSNQNGTIKLGRWNNGKIIIELLDPIVIPNDTSVSARIIAEQTHALMKEKISQLDEEIAKGKEND
ncbi:1-acylglycerol-3-phosphate O-acyltransferase [Colwellia sp. 20A7]|uniref:1-acylglycerol-3-phosphate O-acyltransferase n=1 Tax=Colwellia sp. 20A7 TaxID=2689569 RepID=UPI00135AD240|nr:1-acylglycerol-3-phosphate O-acyltransferase [Colwellia sp. 20A7]